METWGLRTWGIRDLETRDLRIWGLGDLGTCGRGEFGTWRLGDLATWGLGDLGTWGHGDLGTWGLGDWETWVRCGHAHDRISAVNDLASMPTMRARRMARLTHGGARRMARLTRGAGCSQNARGPLPRNKSFVRTLLPRSPAHAAPGIFSNPVSGPFPGRDMFFYWFFTRDLFRSTFKNIILYN